MAGKFRARTVLVACAAAVGLLGGVAATPAAAQPTVLAVPTVSGVSPSSGPTAGGTTVTITGTNFTSTATVAFGGTAAGGVTFVSSTKLTATSPGGTGTVDVTVTTAGGTSAITAADKFTYTDVPTVTKVSPSFGSPAGGTTVTVTGTNFTSTGMTVNFGTAAASGVTFVNSTQLTATSPGGSGKVDVTVTTAAGTSATSFLDKFSYLPTVSGVSPSTGPTAGGTLVTITGTNFTSTATVKFGTVGVAATFVNSTKLTATSPGGSGTVDVTVTTTPGGTSATSAADKFTYSDVPTVGGVSPTFGSPTGGTTVTVTGTNFTSTGMTVAFGTAAASGVTFVNSNKLTATSPGGSGKVDVRVTTPAGTSATSVLDKFSYLPTVTAVSPSSGPTAGGTLVTITGTNFTSTATVKFGTVGVAATFVNSTKLTATSPGGSGTVDVTVTTTPGGTSATSAADKFTYSDVPTVTKVSPSFGLPTGGTTVTVTGTNFTSTGMTVNFGTAAASGVTFVNSNQLTATSPGGSGKVDVTVTTAAGTSAKTALDKFSYLPTVTGVSPSFGSPAGGTLVTITGTNFTSTATVNFGTVGVAATFVNSTKLTATSPGGSGTVDVTVTTTPGGTSATSAADKFSYLPTVSGVSPSSGPPAGGTAVTITGTNFTSTGTTVKFGTVGVAATFVNSTKLTATSPGGSGTVDVTVTTAGGTSAITAADKFTYSSVPTVSSVSPSSGLPTGGTTVTITGSNYTSTGTTVNFGTAAATGVTFVNSGKLTVTSPGGSGTVDVTVTTAGGTSAKTGLDKFSYLPTVSGVSPSSGPSAGGTAVTITGTNFTSTATVKFGTVGVTATFVNSTKLTATSPPGTNGTSVDVTVTTTPGGTSATSAADKFSYSNVPTVTGVSPSSGLPSGGTTVTVNGTNFTSTGMTVNFGTAPATGVTFVNSNQLTATSPGGSGTVDVTVTTPGGTSAKTGLDKFSYLPTVSGVSPSSGPPGGGTVVTITGTNFTSTATVKFGTVAATGTVTFVNSTELMATSPGGSGTVDVTVTTTPGGTSAITGFDKFSYLPTVSGVSPSSGPAAGGTTVTITGSNFTSGATVNFGTVGVAATFVNSTQLTATSPPGTGQVDITVTTAGGTSAITPADKFNYM